MRYSKAMSRCRRCKSWRLTVIRCDICRARLCLDCAKRINGPGGSWTLCAPCRAAHGPALRDEARAIERAEGRLGRGV